MKYRLLELIYGALFILLIAGCGSGEREAILKYRFNPDIKLDFEYSTSITTEAYENDELVYRNDTTYLLEYTQEVIELLGDNRARCKFRYTDAGSGESWINEFIMADNGEITDILADSLEAESMEYFKKLFEQASPEFPANRVNSGFEWTHSLKVLLNGGSTEARTLYKVRSFAKEMGHDCAIIEYKGTMFIPLGDGCPDEKGITTKGRDQIDTDGVIYFSLESGIIIKQNETSRLVRSGVIIDNGVESSFLIEEDRKLENRLVM